MRRLQQILQDHEPGQLRIIAELWGLDPPSGTAKEQAELLAREMLLPGRAQEIATTLRPQAADLIGALASTSRGVPIADLERRYGPIRPMGPGRRDREKPWRQPVSPLEDLWYRGLFGRAFAETPLGSQEFGFLPLDLPTLVSGSSGPPAPFGHAVPEPPVPRRAEFSAVEDAATILSALRLRPGKSPLGPGLTPYLIEPASGELLLHLLGRIGCLRSKPLQTEPEGVRRFLESPRPMARASLLEAWNDTPGWNDLAQIRYLQAARTGWPNDPLAGRTAIVGFVRKIPGGEWWSTESFVRAVHELDPGFQRPGGDFETWYLRQRGTGRFLRGFENWEAVEAALLRSVIAGPLFWLGAVDLGGGPDDPTRAAFRRTLVAESVEELGGSQTEGGSAPDRARLHADGRITFPPRALRAHRYQVARIATWLSRDESGFHFLLTPSALQAARRQGLTAPMVKEILESASGGTLPSPLVKAFDRWVRRGGEAEMREVIVLRVTSASVLTELRRSRATARYLGESVSPSEVHIRPTEWEALRSAAARMGILLDPPGDRREGPSAGDNAAGRGSRPSAPRKPVRR